LKSPSRAHVTSSFTIVKGAMVNETYAVFAGWDFGRSKRQNLENLRTENFIGAKSTKWLHEITRVINRRFDPEGRDRPLVSLAKGGCDLEEWRPLLLWHMTRDEFLLRDFLQNWLFPAYDTGVFRVRPEALHEYLERVGKRRGVVKRVWAESTAKRVAAGLLKIAADFSLLRGSVIKEFASYHLPERSFLYLLHAIRDETPSPSKIIATPDWRLFLMRPSEVEHELLRMHQYRKVDYQVAGSIVQLSLPCASSLEYAERMVA
jgi:hypothetical protein